MEKGLPSHLCKGDGLLLALQGKICGAFYLLRENICVFECCVFLHIKCVLASEAGESTLSATSSSVLLVVIQQGCEHPCPAVKGPRSKEDAEDAENILFRGSWKVWSLRQLGFGPVNSEWDQ